MTVEQIPIRQQQQQQQASVKFELAALIRKWLGDAKSEWKGDEDWNDVEGETIELVTEGAEKGLSEGAGDGPSQAEVIRGGISGWYITEPVRGECTRRAFYRAVVSGSGARGGASS